MLLVCLILAALSIVYAFNSKYLFQHSRRFSQSICSLKSSTVPTEVELTDTVTPGCVLVSQPNEFNHFMVKAVVLVYSHGKGESQGVILERPTAFTMGETAPGIEVFEANTLYMGGDAGNDMAMMFHTYDLGGYSKPIGNGIYLGGLKQARELVESRQAHPKDFKFVFNYSIWPEGVLDKEVKEGRWHVLKCPPEMLIRVEKTTLWSKCRRELRRLGQLKSTQSGEEEEE